MKKHILVIVVAAAVAAAACGKKDKDSGKKQPGPAAGQPEAPAKPAEPVKPADPTASWTEQKGDGFSVMAARAPEETKDSLPSPAGPQPITIYAGYHPAGMQGAFQVALVDMTGAAKKGKIDPGKALDGAVQGWMKTVPGLSIDKQEAIPGEVGIDIRASGTHPQAGPFKTRARVIYKNAHTYAVQALYVDAKDQPMADKFVESFKLTN